MMEDHSYKFLQGGGEMGQSIRSFNWAANPLGPVESWPTSLKITVGIILSTPFPMYIAWGKEYTQLYNDGYRPILGSTKHPQALGISTRETFAEVWHIIESMFDGVMEGKAVGFSNFMLPLNRNGYVEECYFDFSYSPIADEEGNIGGVLVTVIETTEKLKATSDLKETKTALESANAESEEQRDRLKRFFMQAPAGISILDGADLVFELVNPTYQKLFPDRQLLGKPVLEAIPEIKDQPIYDILQDVYKNNKTFEGHGLKVPLASSTGGPIEDRYFDFIYQPRHNVTGTVDGIMVFVYEVTDVLTTKLALEESEKRFRNMVEQSPIPMLVTKGETMIIEEINPPMLELIDRDISVKGKPLFEIMPELEGQPVMKILFDTFYKGESWTGYEQPILIKRNGKESQGFYNVSYKPLIENGKIVGVLQSAADVTEQVNTRKNLEKAEDTLKLALLAARLGTFDLDMEKGTMNWDDRCRILFGINHHNTVTYEHDFVKGLHPEDKERITKIISDEVLVKAVSGGNYNVEYRTVGVEDNEVRWVRAMGKAYFNEQDLPVRFIGTVFDITEFKKDEIRKNDFIGIVSHELKTPLTSLTGYIQMCQLGAASGDYQLTNSLLAKADKQLRKMNNLINDFLNVSIFDAGKISLNKKVFHLDELAKEIIEEAQMIVKTHEFYFKPCEPVKIFADRDKISSVISNLVNNATKYSPNGSTIDVACTVDEKMAMISVKDQGIGIKPEDAKRLFERFYRVESSDMGNISGFGIGLYLSAEIVSRHEGEINVESEPGKGSTFYFKIRL
jgi:two-component system sensor histidine kinase VicK